MGERDAERRAAWRFVPAIVRSEPHAFSAACFYTVAFGARDDDAGSASSQVAVIIAGNASNQRGAGYWQTQYRPRPTAFSEARRQCYLAIAGFMSGVFGNTRPLNTVAQAFDILKVNENEGSETQKLERELLAAWLNFANGAFDLTELLDTNGDGTPDTAFATVTQTLQGLTPAFGSVMPVVVLVDDCVALAAGDQPAVDQHRRNECDGEAEEDAPPELGIAQTGIDRARDEQDESVVDCLHDRDRNSVG